MSEAKHTPSLAAAYSAECDRLRAINADLLAALEAVCALDVIYGREFRNRPELERARAALAKAKGQP